MYGLVLNTDFDWYSFLTERQPLDEVNFWQPSGGRTFHTTAAGTPVFFRLKSPHNAIGGFGFFARASVLPAWLAWDSFGEANGAPTFDAMTQRIEKYRKRERRDPSGRYSVGCLMICEPTFFARPDWVVAPSDWKGQTVVGRRQDLASGEGARIYRDCSERAQARTPALGESVLVDTRGAETRRYGAPTLVRPRLGQGTFRIAVTEVYRRACAVTGEHSLPALDAAHIRPFKESGEHVTSNGLLLRSDIHRLFDKGYVTVTPALRFEVSGRLKDDFENGRSYYPLHGREISAPNGEHDRPSLDHLSWHAENVFLG